LNIKVKLDTAKQIPYVLCLRAGRGLNIILFTTKIKLREDEKTLLEYSREEKLERNKNLAL
jgi:hypothetical protein